MTKRNLLLQSERSICSEKMYVYTSYMAFLLFAFIKLSKALTTLAATCSGLYFGSRRVARCRITYCFNSTTAPSRIPSYITIHHTTIKLHITTLVYKLTDLQHDSCQQHRLGVELTLAG